MSGTATPLSSSTTLTNPPSPATKASSPAAGSLLLKAPSPLPLSTTSSSAGVLPTTASHLVQAISSSHSSRIFLYDVAGLAGFGQESLEWAGKGDGAQVMEMQARAGAGLALLGRLASGAGSSKDATSGVPGNVLTAYITPDGLALMAPSLTMLPTPSQSSRLIVQCPTVSTLPDSTALSPTLGALSPLISALDPSSSEITVLLSSTPSETAALAQLSYALQRSHVVHLFDHFASARELTSVPIPSVPAADERTSLSSALRKANLPYFSYSGDPEATHVLVALNSALALAVQAYIGSSAGLGVLRVRVLRPWDDLLFVAALPPGVQHIHVLDEVLAPADAGLLYNDVLGSVVGASSTGHGRLPSVHSLRITPSLLANFTRSPSSLLAALRPTLPSSPLPTLPKAKKLAFFASPSSALPTTLAHTFLLTPSLSARLLTITDAFSHAGGAVLHRMLLHPGAAEPTSNAPMDYLFPLPTGIHNEAKGEADFLAVLEPALLKSHSFLPYAKTGAAILVTTSWSPEELVASLPPTAKTVARTKALRFYAFNSKATMEALVAASDAKEKGKTAGAEAQLETIVELLAFLRLYLVGAGGAKNAEKIVQAIYGSFPGGIPISDVCAEVWKRLREVVLPPDEDVPDEKVKEKELKEFEFNTVSASSVPASTSPPVPHISSWHAAAKLLLFREASLVPPAPSTTDQIPALRPETSDRTFLVTCSVNRRLTPMSYDRNVFHLEFDTAGTGLTYSIGEALGVHGWNDTDEVTDFCKWYGIDPEALVSVPLPDGARGARHTRTAFQVLQQVVDIFGRPPKSFYAALSPLAATKEDSMALRFISAPEGSSTFKKLSEVDTVTFADVLRMYPSARPGLEELVELVGLIKPRHYSIASAQSAVGDRVDLLVVTVDWVTPSGSPRYGQCTRYLADLKVGEKVTVSIKPSVMKLPPNDLQPIIMAGLGTGAAPFRAFMQHRAWQAAQSIPVGPLIYYFGSRHRSQEYLYGEEIEAYIRDGVIAHAGLAFSRDTKHKIYIQHKMQQDGEMLTRMLTGDDKGVFYLCGPTWPVPDVYATLISSLTSFGAKEKEEAEKYIEDLKEEERYVLEVY